ncbi:MAG: DEAD/DEAH box helicase [Pseudomonadota bacterium]
MSAAKQTLDPQTLLARVSSAVFEQGLALYRSQQVLECELSRVNRQEWGVVGSVRDSKRELCEVSVVLEASDEGVITFFSGSCSCRVGINCQHSVALAVKATYKAGTIRAAVETGKTASPAAPPAQPPKQLSRANKTAPQSLDMFTIDLFADTAVRPAAKPRAKPKALEPVRARVEKPGLAELLIPEAEPIAPEPPATAAHAAAETCAPAVIPHELLQGITPTAHLHITPVAAESVEQLGLLRASLRFNYKGIFHYALNDHNPVLIERADAQSPSQTTPRLLLQRDLTTERAAHDKLRMFGLAGDTKGQFYLPFISSAQQQQWLQWLDDDFAQLQGSGFVVTTEARLGSWITRADSLDACMVPEGQDLASGAGLMDDGNEDHGASETINAGHSAWFSLSLGMNINGVRRNILPLLPELLAQLSSSSQGKSGGTKVARVPGSTLQLPPHIYLKQDSGGYLRLPCEPLRPWLQALLDLMAERSSHKDGDFKGQALRLSRLEALRVGATLLADSRAATGWQGSDKLREMVSQLAGHSALPQIAAPAGLMAELRPYQLQGLRWLQFLRSNGLGGILADDMGLGKTLQTLAHILTEKNAGRLDLPVLVMAPVSLMGNWRREASRFAPGLSVLVLHGSQRHQAAFGMARYDMVIAPYSLLQRDRERWQAQAWHLVVLDEAQNIKNANSHAAKIVSELNTRHRLCLSGTPMENHLGELWSLFHFLMPGFLGSQARFKALYRTPIEKHQDNERTDWLRQRVTPFMLRRHKRDVATDLPEKQIAISSVELGDSQADLYETIRLATEKTVRDALGNKGLAQSQIQIFDALLKLRQVCCDPRLLALPEAHKARPSAKLELLMELLPEMIAEGRKVLLFSQFTSMLALIEQELETRGMAWAKLTGQSQNREEIIERFTSGAVPLFLISLKAGGVGLNLTQADTVIHYDPWWNPAAETQATDRAHRIGQTQRVMVYKLVAQGTIEERILDLQDRKAALAESMYSGVASQGQGILTETDLQALLQPLGA